MLLRLTDCGNTINYPKMFMFLLFSFSDDSSNRLDQFAMWPQWLYCHWQPSGVECSILSNSLTEDMLTAGYHEDRWGTNRSRLPYESSSMSSESGSMNRSLYSIADEKGYWASQAIQIKCNSTGKCQSAPSSRFEAALFKIEPSRFGLSVLLHFFNWKAIKCVFYLSKKLWLCLKPKTCTIDKVFNLARARLKCRSLTFLFHNCSCNLYTSNLIIIKHV